MGFHCSSGELLLVSCRINYNNLFAIGSSSLSSIVSCYLLLQPFQAIKLRKQPSGFMDIFALLQESLILQNDGINFPISSSTDLIASIIYFTTPFFVWAY
jgi:hypothetical protein